MKTHFGQYLTAQQSLHSFAVSCPKTMLPALPRLYYWTCIFLMGLASFL